MKLTNYEWWRAGRLGTLCWIVAGLMVVTLALETLAQGVTTTTVQGTVYLANGQPGGGTLVVSWPAFTTATGQAVAADQLTVTIPADGFVSVNLAPNVGALPAGQYYTAVFYMSDGTSSTQYWQVPAAAEASLAQIQTQVMPAAQAVHAASTTYVDQAITELSQSLLTASGGTLTGPLILNGDPTQPLQAATKHYVDTQVATAVPLAGGNMTGPLGTPAVNGVEAPAVGSSQTTLQTAMNAAGTNGAMEIPPTYAGTDTFTNANGVKVTDLRTTVAQQTERSVKEFGAVCDGVTDDTNALQAALSYANTHNVALTIPEGTCKTRALVWHGESIGGLGKQVSALMGFPGQDVLATPTDASNLMQYTRLHDLTIYVDQSVDVSCMGAKGRAAAGLCEVNRPMETNSIFSPGGNGLSGTAGTGAAWNVGNCAIAMPALTGAGGNGLRVAEIENLEIATTGADPMATQYPGAHSTHTCGMYLAQWPQWSEFRNIDIRGLNTGVAVPALPVATPAGLNADSNRWQNVTIAATHGFTAAAGSNNVLDNVVAVAGNSSATSEPPTGLVLDFAGTQQGWTVRNAVVLPTWNAVQPALTVTAAGGAVTAVGLGTEHGLGWDPYGTSVPVAFSGSCTAQATATVNSDGSIGSVNVTQGGAGCSATTTASVNAAGTWDTAAAVNLISGQEMTLFAGNLLKGNGGYTVWTAQSAETVGTQLSGGGGTLPGGGSYPALAATTSLGSMLEVDQFPGVNFGAKLQACLSAVSVTTGGTCDARNFTGRQAMTANVTISTSNTTVLLPCATISTASQILVTAGTRNVALRGCALRGGSAASGSQGGTAFAYTGAGAVVQVGDATYATDTPGFHMDNAVINTTGATSATASGLVAYRTQELDLESLYLLGNGNQTAMTLDGTGNYTGGTFLDDQIDGFQTGINAIGHQIANPATTDWMNASAFVRVHIDCPTSGGNPVSGTIGINLQQGDGNTFTGGDVEGCATALHLGANAQNNTIVGLRNENSTSQVVADAGSAYNNWMTGGTMFTGKLTDNGTRNSFLDTFHRSFNGLNGDWYGSQQDATVTNHYRLGIGTGNERGLLNEYQTDFGYRWTTGLSDATGGEQFYQIQDVLNNVYRISIGQYNNGQSNTNNQTVINAAGTGAVVLNGSNNSGTGGVVIGSGGASETTVATISGAGNAQLNGTLQVGGTSQSAGTMTVRNNADAEVDYYLWPGLTTSQKGSFTYKDWNGNSQWYMVKDTSNNWALNSAVGGLDSFKAYQSTNSGDTYINSSNATGHIRLNYETGSGVETDIYSGGSSNLVAAFLGTTSIKFPGLAAGSGHYCLQIDNSGYITNTGSACGSGSGGSSGTINSGNTSQIAYYTSNGTVVGGETTVPIAAGGTGAATAAAAVTNLLPGVAADGSNGVTVTGNVGAASATAKTLGGFRYAAPWQTGGGNNGIANASSGATDQTVIADPSYGTTETAGPTSFSALGLHFQDLRAGTDLDFYHDPSGVSYPWNTSLPYGISPNGASTVAAYYDGLTSGFGSCINGCYFEPDTRNLVFSSTQPGWSVGNPGISSAASGWFSNGNLSLSTLVNGEGIGQSLTVYQNKYGIGDNALAYFYNENYHGGWTAPSDEGFSTISTHTDEDNYTYTGTISSGGTTGSTLLHTTAVTDAGSQGVGQYLIDTTNSPCTGKFTNITSGIVGSAITVTGVSGCTITESVAWGTVTANVSTPLNASASPFSSSETFTVTIAGGTGGSGGQFDTTHLACWAGSYHDCAVPTAVGSVSGGTQSVTMPLRRPHASGSYLFQGGMAGYGFEATGYTESPNGQPLRYLFDVVGATNSTTLIAVDWAQGSAHTVQIPATSFETIGVCAGVSSSGSTVSFSDCGTGTLYLPFRFTGSTIVFSGTSVSAFNGVACTNLAWSTQTAGTCTITSVGTHTDTTGGTAQLSGLQAFNLWPMAEILDVQNETLSPPQVDGTLALEPNVIAFSSGHTVESPHHASASAKAWGLESDINNPYAYNQGITMLIQGAGAAGGGGSTTSNAVINAQNGEPDSYYTGNGGSQTPMNFLNFSGAYSYGFNFGEGPASYQPFINIAPTAAQLADPNYCYRLWSAGTASSADLTTICPNTGSFTHNTSGVATYSATSHKFNGAVNGVNGFQVNGNLVLPSTLTGYHGSSSGVRVPLATNWTNTAGAVLCDDGNGNLTITACQLNYTQLVGTVPTWNQSTTGNAATATGMSSNGAANQVWGMNSAGTSQGWQNVSGGGSMTWPSGSAGIASYSGSSAWGTSYNASNPIPANFISTLNQNTTGNAANITATSNSTLTTLSALLLPYTQLTGTVPTWNQSTTGNAATATLATTASGLSGSPSTGQYWGFNGASQGWYTPTAATASTITQPNLGINIDWVADFDSAQMFADAMKQARKFGNPTTPYDEAASVDSLGWPTQDAGVYIITNNQGAWSAGTYALSFTGQATVAAWGDSNVSVGTVTYNSGTNTSTATVTVGSGYSQVVLVFTGTKRTSGSSTGTGVTNVSLMRPTISGTPHAAGTLFTDRFLARLKYFSALRMMDYLQTNGNTEQVWADRSIPAYASQQEVPPHPSQNASSTYVTGASYEYAIQLANQTGKDIWLNIPHLAFGGTYQFTSSTYVTNLALLLKFGSDASGNPYTGIYGSGGANPQPSTGPVNPPLNSGLHVYLEFSNELWNGADNQSAWILAQANAAISASDPDLDWDHDASEYDVAWRIMAKADMETANAFAGVFGSSAFGTVYRPVLAAQIANSGTYGGLAYLQSQHGGAAQYVWAAAGAPYVDFSGDTSGNSLTAAQVISGMQAYQTANIPSWISGLSSVASTYSLQGGMLAYEGGEGANYNTTGALAAQTQPAMRGITTTLLNSWFGTASAGEFFYYDLANGPMWGLSTNLGYDIDADTGYSANPATSSETTPKWGAIKQVATTLNQDTTGTAAAAASISSSGTANQVWGMNSAGTSQGWQTASSGGSMTWPSGSAGIANYSGGSAWGTSYSALNPIPANFISTLNQSTTGNAATASNPAATPTQCSSGLYATGVSATGWAANCATVQYSQLGGTVPTWNQNTTGSASSLSSASALPNGTTATTQSAGDNSTKVATTAYVASPGAITPTTITASGIITGANDSTRTTTTTMTNSWTTTGLVLPTVPVSTTKSGRCLILWQMSSTSYTATFGIGMSNAPTGLWGGSTITYAAAGTRNWLAFSQTATSTTAISTAATAGAANTTYLADVNFTLQTGSSNTVAVTLYGETSSSSGTLTIEPGSVCYWMP